MPQMSDDDLRAIVKQHIEAAASYTGGEIADERRDAMDAYYSQPMGNEIEGRSQVVSSDVQDVIESVMPDLMEIFAGGEKIVEFMPTQPEDEAFSEQATDYVTYIYNKDNPGYQLTHDVLKDAILQKNGVLKIVWDKTAKTKKETFENVNSLGLAMLLSDKDVKITRQTEKEVPPELAESVPDGVLYDLEIERTIADGKIKIMAVPPEEFLISRRMSDLEDAPFTCHRSRKTVSELIEMRFDRDKVEELPSDSDPDIWDEENSRFENEDWPYADRTSDKSMRQVQIHECYLLVDYDGDGIAEMRQVTVGGSQYALLLNEEVDDHPFVGFTAIRVAHRWVGRALADLCMDIQEIKTTIQRQILDNMYAINNARAAVSNKVSLEDFLTLRPGGPVQVDVDDNVGGHIVPIQTVPIGNHAFPLLEYWDSVRETRTSVTRYNQGLDADSLNKTATGVNQILGQAQKRLLFIARTLAELDGFRGAFKKILKLTIENQDRARTIRLRNEWVEMDPRSWNADMDVQVNVGLGHGTKESQTMFLRMALDIQKMIVEFQGGANGPLVTLKNLYNTLEKFTKNGGFKNVDAFFTDPGDKPAPEQQNPEMMKAQVQMQIAQQKADADKQKAEQDLMLEREKHQIEIQKMQMEIQFQREKLELERQEMGMQMQFKQAEAQMNMQNKQAASQMDLQAKQQTHEFNMKAMAAKAAQPKPEPRAVQ